MSVLEVNVAAQGFWRAVIERYTRGNVEERHDRENRELVQTFTAESR